MNIIEASTRQTKTKGDLNTLRANGEIPAVIYGGKDQNQNISFSKKVSFPRKKPVASQFDSAVLETFIFD